MSALLLFLEGIAALITALFVYYSIWVKQKPKIHTGNDKLRTFLDKHVPLLKKKFEPSPLYWEGRLQTILGLQFRQSTPRFFPYTKRELFKLEDGGEIALDFAEVDTPPDGKSLVILFMPGITNTSQTCYVRTLVTQMNKVGASVVVFNQRGLAGVPFKTPRTHSASNTDDTVEVINYLKEKYPDQRRVAFAASLGGMILCQYLIKHGKKAAEIFECAVIVSLLWECDGAVKHMEDDFINRRVLNKQLANALIVLMKKFLRTMEAPATFDMKSAMNARTVREFDVAVTVPQFGFSSVEEYYESATTKGHVHKFLLPVFALNAVDDPLCIGKFLPIDEAEVTDSKLALVTTKHGGHLGFLEGLGNKTEHFMERFVAELVGAVRIHGEKELKL